MSFTNKFIDKKNEIMKKLPKTITYKGYVIPTGKTAVEMDKRREIINSFYQQWTESNPSKKVKNIVLNEFIHVNQLSKKETMQYAVRSFFETMYVLNLDLILQVATPVKTVPAKKNKTQKPFSKMLIMKAIVPDLLKYGKTGKLTVGIRKVDANKIQYCLTAK